MAIERAQVTRFGTALALQSQGKSHVVRRIDLAPSLGDAGIDAPRFSSAEVTDAGDVEVSYADGATELLAAAGLLASLGGDDDKADLVIDNIGLAISCLGGDRDPLGELTNAAIVCGNGRIQWRGEAKNLASSNLDLSKATRIDAGGRLVSPGLIDCHSHPMFAGNRADEFARRAAGQGYQEIAAAGGGIAATLNPTRSATIDEHIALTAGRMDRALAAGTTTSEAKSGYDLTTDGELRLLEIALAVDALHQVDLEPTLLGAHLIPPEHKTDRATYVDAVVNQMVPAAAQRGLANAVDVYCDEGAFTLDETRRILVAGQAAGLNLRAHVGQFADLGAAELIAELGGLSADHLENVSDAGIAAMAANGVVAVMLPGACVQLRMTPPPVEALRDAGVRMAIASDLNPGTSYCETLPIQMWLATTHYGMTVEEAWLGVTKHAAQALGRHDIGVIMVGARADLVIWDADHPGDIPYHYGANQVHQTIKRGQPL